MSLSRAPWLVALVISLAAHGGLVLWLFPTDYSEAEAGSGAGSPTEGSIDAIAGIPFLVESVAPSDLISVSEASAAPDVPLTPSPPAAAVVTDTVPPVAEAATVSASAVETVEPSEVPASQNQASQAQASDVTTPQVTASEIQPAPSVEAGSITAATSPVETVAADHPLDAIPPAVVAAVVNDARPATPEVEPATPETATPVASVTPALSTATHRELAASEPAQPKDATERKTSRQDEPVKRDSNRKNAKPAPRGNGDIDSQKGATTADRSAKSQDQGSGRSRQAGEGAFSWTSYDGAVLAKLRRAVRYPANLAKRDISGVARLGFTIAANGDVGGVVLKQSSGDSRLDEAALAAVRRAAPFPPLPPEAGSRRSIDVPLQFNLR